MVRSDISRKQTQAKTVVILKTHIWSPDLEVFVNKIIADTIHSGADFMILAHDEDHAIRDQIMDPLIRDKLICFTEEDIRGEYEHGFHSMWLSNHWILMWFYHQYPMYQYYWSIEYDVRISGPTGYIWAHDSSCDFLYTIGGQTRPKHKFINHCQGLDSIQKRFGYLQLARYSNKALAWLDDNYRKGINGQDELITYSLIWASDLTRSNVFLYSLIRNPLNWTWVNQYANYNSLCYQRENTKEYPKLCIFHPVK